MKRIFTLFIFVTTFFILKSNAQCTTGNATTCRCADSTQTDCDLLPDIRVGLPPFYKLGQFGIVEYSQTGNGTNDGQLHITVSTPNTGFGPLEIRTDSIFVCGTDTFYGTAPSICPDGITYPKILTNQRIYHKNGNTMTSTDVSAGSMTYHPTHSHMHVDDWGIYTLRIKDSIDPNPVNWQVVGTGTKLAFCVEDYGTCSGWYGHCADSVGNVLTNADFPNYGLGGGGYNCSSVVQGISSGYVDIYWTTLAGMYITVPLGTCNGEYWIVVQVDPKNFFKEENENNNVYAFPYHLYHQVPGKEDAVISTSGSTDICTGGSITLSTPASLGNYLWSTGETTADISVNQAGAYTFSFTNSCGTFIADTVTVSEIAAADPAVTGDTICVTGSALLSASGNGDINWYDVASGGIPVGTGNTFNTPVINTTTTYYAESEVSKAQPNAYIGLKEARDGTGDYHPTNSRYLRFNALGNFTLVSVKVYADGSGNRTIELRNSSGTVLQSATVAVPDGESRITLNFAVTPGTDYRLGLSSNSTADLYRNDSGAVYPYNINNTVNIFGSSSANLNYYYFFYDWEVTVPDLKCASNRIPVEAVVDACAGINNITGTTVSIYPNPASEVFVLNYSGTANYAYIEITDVTGKVVYFSSEPNIRGVMKKSIDTSAFAKGLYFVKVIADGNVFEQKLGVE